MFRHQPTYRQILDCKIWLQNQEIRKVSMKQGQLPRLQKMARKSKSKQSESSVAIGLKREYYPKQQSRTYSQLHKMGSSLKFHKKKVQIKFMLLLKREHRKGHLKLIIKVNISQVVLLLVRLMVRMDKKRVLKRR